MFDRDRWQEIFTTLRKNKLRTFLTAFGVFWGIFMLVIMLGSGTGLHNGVKQDMGDLATNSFFMWTQQTSIPYKGFPRGRFYNFKNSDTQALKDNIPEIEYIAPRLQAHGFRGGGNNVVRGLRTGSFPVYGDYPQYNIIDPVKILSGRFINDLDIKNKRKIAVIGQRVLEDLFITDENPIGEYIRIQGVYFKVVGTFRSKKPGDEADRDNQSIFIPFTTLQKTYNYGDIVGWYSITSKNNVPASVVEAKAKELLKSRHSISPVDDRAIGSFNVEKEFKKMTGLFKGINWLIWIVGTGTLFAGVIGVSNIMLIIVKERTKEIGIQRALGATPLFIISQIITESVFLTTFAGFFGLSLGTALLELVNHFLLSGGNSSAMFIRPEINFSLAMSALAILVVSGALAGMIPARRAVSIKPIDAIRNE
jgi:putative ABC transport system permease protein